MNPAWLDRAPLPTGVVRGTRFVYANDALVALLGVPREAIVGHDFGAWVAPADRELVRERNARRLRGERVPESYEFHLVRGDGTQRPVEIWASATDDGDVVFHLDDREGRALRERTLETRNAALAALNRIAAGAATAGDLAELFGRGAEELRAVIGCDALAVFLVDEARDEGTLAYDDGGTAESRALFGRFPLGATHIGRVARAGVPRVLRREDYDEAGRGLLERMGQRVVLSVPLVARGKAVGVMNAAYFTDHVVAPREIELVQAAGAHFAAAVETERLVTDLRRSYADLARAQAQLVERERLAAIGELAAVVAHEVRNPLGVLFNSLGSLRKLLGADVAGPAATLLEIMDEEATRLNHIVRDLLDFARPTPPALSRDNLEAVVEEAVDAALGEARGRVELVREIGELPLVPMDARLVRQALLNLVDNAVQAMPRGGRLTVRLGADEMGATRAARLEIEDTGPGIAPDVERRIFEPFFTTRASGTGLGLAVVKRIVDGHRGLLRVDTVEGRGTTFTVWLPLDDDGPRSAPGGEGEIPLRG